MTDLQQALHLHRQGQLSEAERRYAGILQQRTGPMAQGPSHILDVVQQSRDIVIPEASSVRGPQVGRLGITTPLQGKSSLAKSLYCSDLQTLNRSRDSGQRSRQIGT